MLVTKIKERKARIGVIGLGYVGLPLLIEFGKSNFFSNNHHLKGSILQSEYPSFIRPLLKLGELFTFNFFLKKFSISDKVFGQQVNCCKLKFLNSLNLTFILSFNG